MSILRAAVIGWPIEHSKSPKLHGYWLQTCGIDGDYTKVATPSEDFNATVKDMVAKGFQGANVTIPHKEAALKLADIVTPRARAIGASNTLIFGPDGVIADNTDGFGFIENLRDRAGDAWNPHALAAVFGAGGASRAILHALLDAGAPEIRLLNRTRSRAETLAAEFGPRIKVMDWDEKDSALPGAGLLVNTTSLGMAGQPPLTLDLTQADKTAVVTDIVYTPLITPFLEAAAAAGLQTVDGLGMLIHQGRPGFEAWFGAAPIATPELRELLLNS